MYDYVIVGAGLMGSILSERIATELGQKVLLIEKRPHIAGNAFDYQDEHGILVHKYGPHIFHTNEDNVWNYLSKFTGWRSYSHKVLAHIDGQKIPIPFNFNSIDKCFSKDKAIKLKEKLEKIYGIDKKVPILNLLSNPEPEIKMLAEYIYDKVFLNYNKKQWGLKPEELDKSVSSRVPIYIGTDDRYFQDKYQGIPIDGYTKMIERIICHKNIQLLLNTDYKNTLSKIRFKKLIYTGPIDYFFDYEFGKLPYRSLEFDFKTAEVDYFQEAGQINYPNDFDYTRITEYKILTGQISDKTTFSFEYPKEYIPNQNEPYYPIPKEDNSKLYFKYFELSKKTSNTIFAGRLAEYKYYNMDQVVARALHIFEKTISVN